MINTVKHLSWVLKTNQKEIYTIINSIDNFYREKRELKVDKFKIPKLKNGNKQYRVLNPSIKRLKVIQKRIQKNILNKIDYPDYAFGAIKGKDNILNAKQHKGKKYKFTTDLTKFFPSINHKMVFKMFRGFDFSPTVSSILTKLTTYKGKVPQGAPTSSSIANLVFIKTGNRLNDMSKKENITFTSFVDDLTFSSPDDFKDRTNKIIDIINDGGFKISHKKTFYSRNPNITGLITMNNHLMLPKSFMKKYNERADKTPDQKKGLERYKDRVNKLNYEK